MKIGFVSEGIQNPNWSSINFYLDGFKEYCNSKGHQLFSKRTSDQGNLPMDCDLYVEFEAGTNVMLDRSKFKNILYVALDIFDPDIDIGWKLDACRTASKCITTSQSSVNILNKAGIKNSGFITWGVYNKIWHKYEVEKEFEACFIGNVSRKVSTHRRRLMEVLRNNNKSIKSNHMELFLDGNAEFLSKAKIGLNMPNKGFDAPNQRDFECIGCCLPLLTEEKLSRFFPENMVTYYKDEFDIVEKFDEVLDNYEEKCIMAKKLLDYCLKEYSYKKVAERILLAATEDVIFDNSTYEQIAKEYSYV